MNIFRLIGQPTHPPVVQPRAHKRVSAGDLSHLASIFILLQKIQATRSCRGPFPTILAGFLQCFRSVLTTQTRYFVQNTGFVCRGIRHSLPGPTVELGFSVQLRYEVVLHRQQLLHPLSHESQVPVRQPSPVFSARRLLRLNSQTNS